MTPKADIEPVATLVERARGRADWYDDAHPGTVKTPSLLRELASAILALEGERDALRKAREQFWLEVRKPRQVPRRGGPFQKTEMVATLREWLAGNPDAFVTVLDLDDSGAPDVQDAAEALQMLDGRSMSVGRRHHETSAAAFRASEHI
jgi:hypothetical protein